jgi:hypothetical protein
MRRVMPLLLVTLIPALADDPKKPARNEPGAGAAPARETGRPRESSRLEDPAREAVAKARRIAGSRIAEGPETRPGAFEARLRFEPGRPIRYGAMLEKSVGVAGTKIPPFVTRSEYVLRLIPLPAESSEAVPAGGRSGLVRESASLAGPKPAASELEAGMTKVEVRFERILWSMSGGETAMEFDSADFPPRDEPADQARLRRLINRPFVITLDDRGQVGAVTPPEPIEPSRAGVTRPVGPNPADLVGENQLRNLFKTFHAWLPDGPVRAGDTWDRSETMPVGPVSLTRTAEVRCTHRDRSIAQFESLVRMKPAADSEAEGDSSNSTTSGSRTAKANPFQAEVAQPQPGRATIVFDVARGEVVSVEGSISWNLRISKPVPTGGSSADLTQTLTARSTWRRLDPGAARVAN